MDYTAFPQSTSSSVLHNEDTMSRFLFDFTDPMEQLKLEESIMKECKLGSEASDIMYHFSKTRKVEGMPLYDTSLCATLIPSPDVPICTNVPQGFVHTLDFWVQCFREQPPPNNPTTSPQTTLQPPTPTPPLPSINITMYEKTSSAVVKDTVGKRTVPPKKRRRRIKKPKLTTTTTSSTPTPPVKSESTMRNDTKRYRGGQHWRYCNMRAKKTNIPYPRRKDVIVMYMLKRGIKRQNDMVAFLKAHVPRIVETFFVDVSTGEFLEEELHRYLDKAHRIPLKGSPRKFKLNWFRPRGRCSTTRDYIWSAKTNLDEKQRKTMQDDYTGVLRVYAQVYALPIEEKHYVVI